MRVTWRMTIVWASLGLLAGFSASADTYRYQASGDWMASSWQNQSQGTLDNPPPGASDTARMNWGDNTVTLAATAPAIGQLQIGVDESGKLQIDSGGSLTVSGNSKIGNNGPLAGRLTINSGGVLHLDGGWTMIGGNTGTTGIVTIAGGELDIAGHLWVASATDSVGSLAISGGTVRVGGMLGVGTVNAVDPSGGAGKVQVDEGGLLALSNIHGGGTSVQPGSYIDLTGSGQLTLPGNFTGTLEGYVNNGYIRGNGLVGNVQIDTTTNPGFTTATALSTPEPPDTAPTLSIRRLGGSDLELSWEAGRKTFITETTNDLTAAGPWALVDRPVVVYSNQATQVVTGGDPQGFYRLNLAWVDNSTLSNKSMMGYQGWFGAPTDGTPVTDRWHHWAQGSAGMPDIGNWGIDFYPDMSEYTAAERYEPGWTLNNGDTAYLFSSAHPETVERHCRWMWEYGIDGVFLQRFLGEVQDPRFKSFRNQVTRNIKAGSETYGRLYAIMYDVSGVDDADMLGYLTTDWNYLVGVLDVTNSPSCAHHNGKPVVAIWGLGFKDRGLTPGTAADIISFFKGRGMTVMGGVPDSWRTLNGDSETDPDWAAVYRSFDIISPWTVGRYNTLAKVDNWRVNKIEPDLAAATAAGADYMPVIWPGFSWYNIHGGTLNQIPRLGGEFYWRQAYNARLAGCAMLYTAMFDEMDEGTAMLKMAETSAGLPAGASMVPLDADGISLPSDWYLQLGGEAARMLRGEIPLQSTIPISP